VGGGSGTPPSGKPPLEAKDDTLSVPLDTSGNVSVLNNDSSANGGNVTVDSYDDVSVNGGTVVYNGDGTFTYTPRADFAGQDTFTYTIKDSNGTTAKGKVTVTVSAQVIPNGMAYYAAKCAICHAAGADDVTVAFNSSDLAKSTNVLTNDLTMYGGQYSLMGAFDKISQPNVDELIAYLNTFK
jgi:mono/diheme cytochrome c family protein